MKLTKQFLNLAAGVAMFTAIASSPLQAAEVSEQRIADILSMSPTEMAMTGAWTVAAYDRLMGYVNSMQDETLRTLVLDMLNNPESTAFGAKAEPDALRTAPATGGPGHHHYPGGLAVHLLENIEIAMGTMGAFENVHGVSTINRDLIIAELALHDWSKVWYNWDEDTGKVKKPDWFPKSWGGKDGIAKWGWMGEHGAVVYAELLKRGAPQELLFGAASAHFDPQWDVSVTNKEGKDEGFDAAMAEAAGYAGTEAPKLDIDRRQVEWFLSNYADGGWSFSHYVAGKSAHKWIRAVAADLGIDPESPQAAKLAWFVLTRVSDFKLYMEYQNSDFSESVVKDKILSVIADSSPYEVK